MLAIKDGKHKYFSDRAWDIGNPTKYGWVELGNVEAIEEIKVEKIEIVETDPDADEKVDEKVEQKEQPKDVQKEYPTDEEIKKYLKDNNIKFHHMSGTKKLRAIYDDNTK